MTTYWVHRRSPWLLELRQARYREAFKRGKAPHHDVCTEGTDRAMLERVIKLIGLSGEVDWSEIDAEEKR